ncbi:uncharacterized protein LOC132715571 [Ruditapes philippinarum]|uniref:uncharacterized protein LOC132715571 n=1 Tax=Ruditapes philippinarum TaxID=129788 RepID=UPI00295B93D2|nr:uncharacterized protein LOC132715571 [Ruditapes philippinarum]
MTTDTIENLSKGMSNFLDIRGYDHQRIKERIHHYNKCSLASDIATKFFLNNHNIEEIFVGSLCEGIGMSWCNDLDVLHINHSVICCKNSTFTENDKVIFKMEQIKAPAGYTYLKLLSNGTDPATYESLEYAIDKRKSEKYLSSKLFVTKEKYAFHYKKGSLFHKITYYKSQHGPAIPTHFNLHWILKKIHSSMNINDLKMDFVRAFPCQPDDEILDAWKSRDRKCGWPRQETIAHVMSLQVYVVPVGQKGSRNEDLQWRISFTLAETHLIQAFNNTQTKVLVLMKLIAKHILQPLCSEITSYVVKTVMLWQAERMDQNAFCVENLLSRLMDALTSLKSAVENKNLPSYMIPQKNLLENKIDTKEQGLVLRKLKELESNGLIKVKKLFYSLDLYHAEITAEIDEIFVKLYNANSVNKVEICIVLALTTEELVNYYRKMYTCRSWYHYFYHEIITLSLPYFLKYGKQVHELPYSTTEQEEEQPVNNERQERLVHEYAILKVLEQWDSVWDIIDYLSLFALSYSFLILILLLIMLSQLPSRFVTLSDQGPINPNLATTIIIDEPTYPH